VIPNVRQRLMLLVSLAMLMASFGLALGCARTAQGNSTPANAALPKAQPAGPPDLLPALPQSRMPELEAHAAWLAESPWRNTMRALWAECGMIVYSGAHHREGRADSAIHAADSIARKALRLASLWRSVSRAALGVSKAAKTQKWEAANEQYAAAGDACCDCHVESWPLTLRGYTPAVVEMWRKEGASGNAPWVAALAARLKEKPKNSFAVYMREIDDLVSDMQSAISNQDSPAADAAAIALWKAAEAEYTAWNDLQTIARAISAAAGRGDATAMQLEYGRMRNACITCHAAQAKEERELLHPPKWE
jgi:hypothetical protein